MSSAATPSTLAACLCCKAFHASHTLWKAPDDKLPADLQHSDVPHVHICKLMPGCQMRRWPRILAVQGDRRDGAGAAGGADGG